MYWDVIEESWNQLKEQVRKQWGGFESSTDEATGNRDPSTDPAPLVRHGS